MGINDEFKKIEDYEERLFEPERLLDAFEKTLQNVQETKDPEIIHRTGYGIYITPGITFSHTILVDEADKKKEIPVSEAADLLVYSYFAGEGRRYIQEAVNYLEREVVYPLYKSYILFRPHTECEIIEKEEEI